MSDIGGLGSSAIDPFAAAAQRSAGIDAVEQQRQLQDRVSDRTRDALLLKIEDPDASADRARQEIQQSAGPGERRDAVIRTEGSPQFTRLSDETATAERAGRNGSAEAPRQNAPPRDEVSLSPEAQRRLAAENATPPPGESVAPPQDDPLRIDTAQEEQRLELSTPIDRSRNETPAGQALGQLLDQFS